MLLYFIFQAIFQVLYLLFLQDKISIKQVPLILLSLRHIFYLVFHLFKFGEHIIYLALKLSIFLTHASNCGFEGYFLIGI